MAVSILFLDNETYGANDVNKAFSRLTTQGVSLFQDTGAPLTNLNTAVSNLVESGVELYNIDACKVTSNEGIYQIMPGTAWIGDGSSITIDSEPYQLNVTDGVLQYVYFQRNIGMNTIDIVVSSIKPPEDALLLATISADGTVTDRRTYAKTKVAPATANIVIEKQTGFFYVSTTDPYNMQINIGYGAFSHIQFVYDAQQKCDICSDYITLAEGVEQTVEVLQVHRSSSRGVDAKITKNGNILDIQFMAADWPGSHNFKLILF